MVDEDFRVRGQMEPVCSSFLTRFWIKMRSDPIHTSEAGMWLEE